METTLLVAVVVVMVVVASREASRLLIQLLQLLAAGLVSPQGESRAARRHLRRRTPGAPTCRRTKQ